MAFYSRIWRFPQSLGAFTREFASFTRQLALSSIFGRVLVCFRLFFVCILQCTRNFRSFLHVWPLLLANLAAFLANLALFHANLALFLANWRFLQSLGAFLASLAAFLANLAILLANLVLLLASLPLLLANLALFSKFGSFSREFGAFTRQFGCFSRQFSYFTRQFGAFTREFAAFSRQLALSSMFGRVLVYFELFISCILQRTRNFRSFLHVWELFLANLALILANLAILLASLPLLLANWRFPPCLGAFSSASGFFSLVFCSVLVISGLSSMFGRFYSLNWLLFSPIWHSYSRVGACSILWLLFSQVWYPYYKSFFRKYGSSAVRRGSSMPSFLASARISLGKRANDSWEI